MHDVCLIIENHGNVEQTGLPSAVIHLIRSLPDIRFAVFSITRKHFALNSLLGEIPANLHEYIQFTINEESLLKGKTPQRKAEKEFWLKLNELYNTPLEEKIRFFESVIQDLAVDTHRVINYSDIIRSRKFWDLNTSQYKKYASHIPFIDYTWIFRTTQLPFFQLMHANIPHAKIYHIFSPRYAACAGLIAKMRFRSHLIFDIQENTPLVENLKLETFSIDSTGNKHESSFTPSTFDIYKKTYNANTKMFHFLASFYSDFIIVHNRNPQPLFDDEGIKHKYVFVPPGMEAPRTADSVLQSKQRPCIGIVGEINPHGDIKTSIKAGKLLQNDVRDIWFKILSIGNTNAFYMKECIDLKNSLGLNFSMEIVHEQHHLKTLSCCDVVIFSQGNGSGENLLLTALQLGKPIIGTNEPVYHRIIQGHSEEDRNLGECGLFINTGSPHEIAQTVQIILNDKKLNKEMSRIAQRRFELYYSKSTGYKTYESLYRNYI
ncbi:MAG: GT4 family glycosyltransferase PelF [Spirochaetales bacterium]|nr:GT4 family glycosyltransferase PelF [Spirochaetales bacterium]